MKKICFVVSSPLTAKAFLKEHFRVLSRCYQVTLVARFEDSSESVSEYLYDQKHIEICRNINVARDLRALYLLYRYFKAEQFDLVHTVTPKAGLLGMVASWLAGIEVRVHIFTGQVWHTSRGLKREVLKFFDRLIAFFSTIVLVDGHSQRNFLIKNGVVKKYNSRVLGRGSISGADIHRFSPSFEYRVLYRNRFFYSNSDVVFAFLGRMTKDKGILDLASAFSFLQSELKNVKLLLIGYDEGGLEEQIYRICPSNVLILGPTNCPEKVLQAADIFCLPSYREGFGTSVIEASLLELAIVCSNTYGLADTILEGITGLRHKVGDIDDLYLCMRRLAENITLRREMGVNGRRYVLENFSAEAISKEWLYFYNTLL